MKRKTVRSPHKSLKSKSLQRERLNIELKRIGKVGGIKDARLGARNTKQSDRDKHIQRHIVERLRRLDKVTFEQNDGDPIIKAAFGESSEERLKTLRLDEKSDVGIHAHVTEEFFSSGSHRPNFQEILTEKIASSKLEKLKRVEENEEQRDRMKAVNAEWSQKIRFLLSNVPIKSKKSTSAKVKINRTNFLHLLEAISANKRVIPVGAPHHSTQDLQAKRISRLQTMLSGTSVSSAKETSEEALVKTSGERKNVSDLLRTLSLMPEHKTTVLLFLTNQLATMKPSGVKQSIQVLWLTQLVLESCEKSVIVEQQSQTTSNLSNGGSGAYCPELISTLTSLVLLAQSVFSTKFGSEVSSSVNTSPYAPLDIQLTDPLVKLSRCQLPKIWLSWFNCLVNLCARTHTLYSNLLPSNVCAQVFAPTRNALRQLNRSNWPTDLSERVNALENAMHSNTCSKTPEFLTNNLRLTVLRDDFNEPTTLKKMGLVPQLEPRFDEKMDVRRVNNVSRRQTIQRNIAREKRSAIREMRQNSQLLAAHQLDVTKQLDEDRNKKTQMIIRSMRSIED